MAAITRDEVSGLRAFFRALLTPLNLSVLAVLLAFAVGMSAGSARVNNDFAVDLSPGWWTGWLQNFSTEMFGAFLTFLLIEVLVSNRRAREATERETEVEKAALILQMGSPDNAFAVEAVRQLRARGWLEDGSLRGADLSGASLQRAYLIEANLQEAILSGTNLQLAILSGANLQGANLFAASLQEATLIETNLQEATLSRANLQEALLPKAGLQGATLLEANLQGVGLIGDEFDEGTILPNSHAWTPDTDITRFTDPKHPEFWRSDEPASPAYRGANDPDDPDYERHKSMWPDVWAPDD